MKYKVFDKEKDRWLKPNEAIVTAEGLVFLSENSQDNIRITVSLIRVNQDNFKVELIDAPCERCERWIKAGYAN